MKILCLWGISSLCKLFTRMGAQISLDDYCSQTKPYSQPYNLGWKQHQNFGWSKNHIGVISLIFNKKWRLSLKTSLFNCTTLDNIPIIQIRDITNKEKIACREWRINHDKAKWISGIDWNWNYHIILQLIVCPKIDFVIKVNKKVKLHRR